MSYRTFTDSAERKWEVWLVLPTSAERRRVDRRVAMSDMRVGAGVERRVASRRLTPSGMPARSLVSPDFEKGWLCFESEGEKRRLAPVPPSWDHASSDQLSVWCQAARRVMKCGPGT